MARLIETSHVEWDPGTRYGYHGGSFGFIVDELRRRLAGRTAGQILHEIAVKVGHPDCYIGLPQPYMKRVAKLQFLEPDQRPTAGEGNPHPPFGANGWYNNERVLASCQPSGGGVASAVALAGVLNLVAGWGCYRGYRAWAAAEQMEASRVRSPRGEERPASASLEGGSWGTRLSRHADADGVRDGSSWTVDHGSRGCIRFGCVCRSHCRALDGVHDQRRAGASAVPSISDPR
jgi:hypothetical protein